ncbi:MAG: hypothetical protein PHC64_05825 [Candidatus Gastranaerophilales bacterium]|nr:hypothetical protein [Candidatus Gastranaerophilales bacterium]
MIKKILYSFILVSFLILPSYAEKIPVKISLTQIISTHHDEVEIGDKINFMAVKDIYVDEKLYIKKDTPIVGVIDYVHPNGWSSDYAQITFKTFYTKDVDNKKITISSPLTIKGNENLVNHLGDKLNVVLGWVFRGAEIFVEPDTKIYNIFM